jgi:hypothetical protein
MPDVGPDMDDLLRRASDEYPLKEVPDNWSEIVSRLSAMGEVQESRKRSSRKLFYGLILLLFFLCAGLFLNRTGKSGLQDSNVSIKSGGDTQNTQGKQKEGGTAPLITDPFSRLKGADITTYEGELSQDKQQGTARVHQPRSDIAKAVKLSPGALSKKTKKNGFTSSNEPGEEHLYLSSGQEYSIFTNRETLISRPGAANWLRGHSAQPASFIQLPLAPMGEKQKTAASSRKFYFGLTAGAGFSMVKNSGLQKSGFDVGLLAGYRPKSRVSLETGVLVVQKFYATEGKNFSMEEVGSAMPAGMKLMEVEGSSRVVELPLHLRYDFIADHRKRFFSTTGFSSFWVTKERNTYHAMMNGVPEKMYGAYSKDRRYFAAAFDLGLGYETHVQSNIAIRIEPYVQIPIRGIGVGKLPVRSAGVRLGITRPAQ